MTLNRSDIETLLKAGVEIIGDFLRIDDVKNKVTYEFRLSEIGQLTLKKKYRLSIKKQTKQELIVHKWDMSSVQVDVSELEDEELKIALRSVNTYFAEA